MGVGIETLSAYLRKQGVEAKGNVIPRSPPRYQYWDPIEGLPSGAAVYTTLENRRSVKFKLGLVTDTVAIRFSR
eukprot:SAG31_NODE_3_length_45830_cov_42.279701_29_plen_74_part_00